MGLDIFVISPRYPPTLALTYFLMSLCKQHRIIKRHKFENKGSYTIKYSMFRVW